MAAKKRRPARVDEKSSRVAQAILHVLGNMPGTHRHASSRPAQAVRDRVVRAGGRVIVRRAILKALQAATERIGVKVTQRAVGSAVSRWIPVLGAVGVGAYAYYDTAQVSRTALNLFSRPLRIEPEPDQDCP